jgi:predicted flap endonuclease-1-like 5' DNA nuclease
MLHKSGFLFAFLLLGLSLTGFSSPVAAAEGEGTPWWVWLLIIIVLLAFFALLIWWWLRRGEGEEEKLAAPARPEVAVRAPAVEAADTLEGLRFEAPAPPTPEVEVRAPVAEAADTLEGLRFEAPTPSLPPEPDDLKLIEGIGPKISAVLQAAGILTFAQLAETRVDRLHQILQEANPNLLRLADPTTWPEQAGIAAKGDWEALEQLQAMLKGGRRA